MIVERGWLWEWFKAQGFDPTAHGFDSMEWMVLGSRRPTIEEPLSSVEMRDQIAAVLARLPAAQSLAAKVAPATPQLNLANLEPPEHDSDCSCCDCLEATAWAEDAYRTGQDALHDAQRL